MRLKDWWVTHRNGYNRQEGDLVGLGFEEQTSWDVITKGITGPRTDEGRLMWNEI